MTNQSELEHRPSCAIYRKPTPSGCYWCCDCKMTRFVAVKSESQQNKQSELVDKIHEFANGWLKPTAGVRVLDVESLVDYITQYGDKREAEGVKRGVAEVSQVVLDWSANLKSKEQPNDQL